MVRLSSTKLIAAVGGAAMALTAAVGVASADPLVDTTCNETQVLAALNVQDPALAQKFADNPIAGSTLRRFLASDPAGRQEMVVQLSGSSWAGKYMGAMQSVAATCNNF